MPSEVYANGLGVCCKAADGLSICAFPDICFTPPPVPIPPGLPIPYPNTGKAKDIVEGSTSVSIANEPVMLKNSSYFQRSTGDEAGSAQPKGIITFVNMGKVYAVSWSMNVMVEGENVVRAFDLTTHNHAFFPGNTPPWPYIDKVATPVEGTIPDPLQNSDRAAEIDQSTRGRPLTEGGESTTGRPLPL